MSLPVSAGDVTLKYAASLNVLADALYLLVAAESNEMTSTAPSADTTADSKKQTVDCHRFKGRVAAITGGAQGRQSAFPEASQTRLNPGIGFGIAQRLAAEGAIVALLDMKPDVLETAVKVLSLQQTRASSRNRFESSAGSAEGWPHGVGA